MRKIFAAVILLILSCCPAFAAERLYYEPIELEFEDGIKIEFLGAYVYNYDGNINVLFKITSDTDTLLRTSADTLFDDKGGKFYLDSIRIAGYRTSRRDILANVPAIVLFEFPSVYEPRLRSRVLRTISNARFAFNDHEVNLENVQMLKWRLCLRQMKTLGFAMREWFER